MPEEEWDKKTKSKNGKHFYRNMYDFIDLKSSLHDLESDDSQNIHVSEQIIKHVWDNRVLNLFLTV